MRAPGPRDRVAAATMSERHTLAGLRVVVTRAAHQAAELCRLLEERGAQVVTLPLLEVVPPADPAPLEEAVGSLSRYRWVAITSPNTVEALAARLEGSWPEGTHLAAVGPATAAALRRHGLEPEIVAELQRAEGLVDALARHLSPGEELLVPQAAEGRPTLIEGLRERGFRPHRVDAYRKRLPADAAARLQQIFQVSPLGWVTFTSPSIVRHFVELLGRDWDARRAQLRAASIGAVTSKELRRHGVDPAAEAAEPSDEALVEAIVRAYTGPPQVALTDR